MRFRWVNSSDFVVAVRSSTPCTLHNDGTDEGRVETNPYGSSSKVATNSWLAGNQRDILRIEGFAVLDWRDWGIVYIYL